MAKMMTIEEFNKLGKSDGWQRVQSVDVRGVDHSLTRRYNPVTGTMEETSNPHVWGHASVTSVLGGVMIRYTERFEYDLGDPETLDAGAMFWNIHDVTVVNEGGKVMSWADACSVLDDEFSLIDYRVIEETA